jgi:Tfp pilus assembly protein PilN
MRPINLLPKDTAPQGPRLAVLVGAALVVWALVLALATVAVQGRADDAERANEAIVAEIERLTGRVIGLEEVRVTIEEYEAAAAVLEVVLVGDVSWGDIMTSLSSEIPSRVWLEGFAGTTGLGEQTVGRITMTGVGFDYPDISDWIRSLDADAFPGVSGAWVQSVSESTIGAAEVVVFSSTTSLTEEALSSRLRSRLPEVR